MSDRAVKSTVEGDRVLVLERTFAAPRALVFEMYSKAEHLVHWWGPRGWDLPFCEVDFRPGGVWLYCMKCVDESQGDFYGMESWGKAVYSEIVEPERIAFTDFFCNSEGEVNDEMPSTKVTVTFVDLGEQTRLVTRGEYVSPEALQKVLDMGMLEGIGQTWDRLDEHLRRAL